ncbi:NADH-quinone oxidoreductase subunit L [Ferruginibacter sp. HRS2-29]|uniref:NADH-quinone oxidoreductase subunit L n=1 Tax=Ferruginibacter sp. HRS2-29 TaxID=2487334 RepID=UPI0020CC57BD|nr:NADH-quinone oxidoreductase subunit L [Ferruginibacter sp. HRS2-29]MCP9750279.1 NADH-quinone oxidoreductase subunit L [Ferruginibacter sp. HRS2-29]
MNNVLHIVWLIPILPLIGFLINGLFRNSLSKSVAGFVGSAVILASFALSIFAFLQVKSGNTHLAHYFNLINIDALRIGFDFKIDQLSSLFLLIITGVGFLIHVYSTSYMHEEPSKDFAKYFAYLNLFVFSMLLLVMGGNYIIMFIGWEGVGLCSYLLIGFWFKNNDYTNAAKKAFIMNRIGDLGFLLAVFWLISKIGTVSYDEVFSATSLAKLSTTDITGITLLFFVGATGKSAQIPLYTWLPDAMAGPTPVSALIHAATMVTAGIYMIARSSILYSMAPVTQCVVAIVGLSTAILAATIALKQNDIKKVLAYSTVSQLGYMFLGLGVGAYTGAVFHVMTHAFFKALLFLGAGSVIHAMGGEQDMRNMGGLKKHMRITHLTFLLGCIAIAGIPPFSGFFSKDEILAAAFEASPVFWVIGVAGAMMTAFYMFRLYGMTFLGKFRGTHEQEHHLHESPAAITFPLIVLAILAVFGGFVGIPEVFVHGGHKLAEFLAPVFAQTNAYVSSHHAHEALSHNTEYILMGTSVLLALVALSYAINKFSKYQKTETASTGLAKVLENKWYVDELYDAVIVKPLRSLSAFFNNVIEKKGIDGLVNGVGKAVNYGGRQLRWIQSGQVGAYVLLMVIGMLVLFIIQFFVKNI